MTQTEFLLIVLGGIFVIEVLSVVIQVISFQSFRKRVFLMAPIHHHFELKAWSETKIILRFWIVAVACGAIGFVVYQQSLRGVVSAATPTARPAAAPPGPYVVVGLARSGVAAALALRARGEEVWALDTGAAELAALEAAAARLRAAGAEVQLGERAAFEGDLARRARALVKSPGVPREAPVVAAALGAGLTVLGELELAWRLLRNRFIAVTGTNGKTTTTEWIGHILRVAGAAGRGRGQRRDRALLARRRARPRRRRSSASAPRSSSRTRSRSRPRRRCCSTSRPITSIATARSSATSRPSCGSSPTRATTMSRSPRSAWGWRTSAAAPAGCAWGRGRGPSFHAAGQLWWDERPLLAAAEISLPGAHNRANAMAAAAACLAGGVEPEAVAEGLRTFAGVAHRLEDVGSAGGVRYVNDSKATNVDSTLVALRRSRGGVHLILGGRGKAQDFTPLAGPVAAGCRAVYLIGEAADEIAGALAATGVELVRAGTLRSAVERAAAASAAGETVLLSPACASYDQFSDFEARGDAFRALVAALR